MQDQEQVLDGVRVFVRREMLRRLRSIELAAVAMAVVFWLASRSLADRAPVVALLAYPSSGALALDIVTLLAVGLAAWVLAWKWHEWRWLRVVRQKLEA